MRRSMREKSETDVRERITTIDEYPFVPGRGYWWILSLTRDRSVAVQLKAYAIGVATFVDKDGLEYVRNQKELQLMGNSSSLLRFATAKDLREKRIPPEQVPPPQNRWVRYISDCYKKDGAVFINVLNDDGDRTYRIEERKIIGVLKIKGRTMEWIDEEPKSFNSHTSLDGAEQLTVLEKPGVMVEIQQRVEKANYDVFNFKPYIPSAVPPKPFAVKHKVTSKRYDAKFVAPNEATRSGRRNRDGEFVLESPSGEVSIFSADELFQHFTLMDGEPAGMKKSKAEKFREQHGD